MDTKMADYLVTVKLPHNPAHNPNQKISGICPAFSRYCTDVTGAHHTTLVTNMVNVNHVENHFKALGFHVTRIEKVDNT